MCLMGSIGIIVGSAMFFLRAIIASGKLIGQQVTAL